MAIAQPQTRTSWTIDPAHTLVEFSAKHMMVTTVKGRFTGVTGTIVGDLADPSTAQVDVEIDAATIDTRNEQRDAHLRSGDFLEVETYPSITFKSTRIERTGDNQFSVIGDLTLHGVTRQVTLETEINGVGKTPYGSEVVGISSTTKISRKDFGLEWNVALETGGWLVGDTIKIELEVQAARS